MAGGGRRCTPCQKGTPPLGGDVVRTNMQALPHWALSPDGKSIARRGKFADFDTAFASVRAVAELARLEDHHPDIEFGWGYAAFTLTTHAIGGLHENDFIVAAGIDEILASGITS